MRTEVYWVSGLWPGRLGIVPRPRGGDWLEDEVRSWKASQIDVVASLLTPEEASDLGLQREEGIARQEGLGYYAFPIPDSRAELLRFLSPLEKALESGKNVVVHCRAGIGRSSTVVVSLLVSAGLESEEAFRRIEKARGRPVPDTPEQREWVVRNVSAAVRSHED